MSFCVKSLFSSDQLLVNSTHISLFTTLMLNGLGNGFYHIVTVVSVDWIYQDKIDKKFVVCIWLTLFFFGTCSWKVLGWLSVQHSKTICLCQESLMNPGLTWGHEDTASVFTSSLSFTACLTWHPYFCSIAAIQLRKQSNKWHKHELDCVFEFMPVIREVWNLLLAQTHIHSGVNWSFFAQE